VWNLMGGMDWLALPIVADMLDIPAEQIEQVIADCIVIHDYHNARD
jgi:hypothetical protein